MTGQRRRIVLEMLMYGALITLVSLNAMWRMDYLGSSTRYQIRMTDASRSALVGRNIAEGQGYKTNDLPAMLLDFYDQRGKLHDDEWVNADRFPFAAYAVALLMTVCNSTSYEVGILLYNLICFVAFLLVLFQLTRKIWGDRWSALIAVGMALLHPYTYLYLYLKDADMLLLTGIMLLLFFSYFSTPPETMSRRLAVGIGTVLAWLFLSRPNLGAPFILYFAIIVVRRLWILKQKIGALAALRAYVFREGVVLLMFMLWCAPFVAHSLAEWNSPLFSANNLYQLPLGTRFAMGTDTWWKYTEPGHPITLGMIASGALPELATKFTSSWVATTRSFFMAYTVEIILAIGLLVARRHGRSAPEAPVSNEPLRQSVTVIGFSLLTNLALLPLYGYQDYAYRHYLGFVFPLIWLLSAKALHLLGASLLEWYERLRTKIQVRPGRLLGLVAAAAVLLSIGASRAPDANELFARVGVYFSKHWFAALVIVIAIVSYRWIFRPPWYPRFVVLVFAFVYACYRPDRGIKRTNLIWFPADDSVWMELRKRKGIVSSLALQGEVGWNTGRKNIPVPEWPMHLYSYRFDHALDIEDVYLESTPALLSNEDGPFAWMAPGFEGYERLQRYPGHLPGYEVAFHRQSTRGYPKFGIKPHPKASTVYHLVDPSAIEMLRRSPQRLDLGNPDTAIYAAHGWGPYVKFEGRPVMLGNSRTRTRYPAGIPGPWEDSSITFFLDERRPVAVDLEFYAPRAVSYTFYWNLDLYTYDEVADRTEHVIGIVGAASVGWRHAHLTIPARLTRSGLNKLGFRTSAFYATMTCPPAMSDEICLRDAPGAAPDAEFAAPRSTMKLEGIEEPAPEQISLMVGTVEFKY